MDPNSTTPVHDHDEAPRSRLPPKGVCVFTAAHSSKNGTGGLSPLTDMYGSQQEKGNEAVSCLHAAESTHA